MERDPPWTAWPSALGDVRNPMNMAFVLPYLADRFGGPVTVTKNLGRKLADLGYGVSYWATVENGDHAELASLRDAHLYAVDWPHSWYRSKGLARGLSAHMGSVDIAHIYGLWRYPTLAASSIAKNHGVPYILRPAGCLEPWARKHKLLKRLKKALYMGLIGRPIMRSAACLQAASRQEAEHFRDVGYHGPITIIPNGVDIQHFTPGDRAEAQEYWPTLKDRLVVVFMSRLSPEKGLDILIPVWADLVGRSPYKESMLVVAGPDDRGYQRVVEAMIDMHNVRPRVSLVGMVRGREKLALLRRADAFILPSYSENFGIVVAEALACGTPVITTTGTPWEQLQDVDAGRWVPPTREHIGIALRDLLGMSQSRREAMGKRGMLLIRQDYGWERVVDKFTHVCNCILGGRSIPLHPEPQTYGEP